MNADWELGSEFHWGCAPRGDAQYPWTGFEHLLGGSGRDVLSAVLAQGQAARGWKRLWLPAYLCQEVAAACDNGLELHAFDDLPLPGSPIRVPGSVQSGDVVLVVNHWGIRRPIGSSQCPEGVALIEDHTHDLWSQWAVESKADYAIASLRKTLPLADGGVAWSPLQHDLGPELPRLDQHEAAANQKLAGMVLKREYLAGSAVSKDAFRRLFQRGEAMLVERPAAMSTAGQEVLSALDTTAWREMRAENLRFIHTLIRANELFTWIGPEEVPDGQVAFSLLLQAASPEIRESLRAHLIQHRVYPAVLWPLDETVCAIPESHRDFARRSLSIHIDGRYGRLDLRHLADILNSFS